MEFCNSYVLCLQAFFSVLCAPTTVYVSEWDILLGLFLMSLRLQCRALWAAVSESEHKFDTLKVTAVDLLPESEVTSRLSVGISAHESDLRTAQTYLGYRKTGKHSKFLAHVGIKMFVKIRKASFWTKNQAGIHSAGSVCLSPACVSQGSLWY